MPYAIIRDKTGTVHFTSIQFSSAVYVDINVMFAVILDRTFSHSGASKSYQDTAVDLTPFTWIVLQVGVYVRTVHDNTCTLAVWYLTSLIKSKSEALSAGG